MAKKKKFIQGAIKKPGDLTRKAKNEGKTVSQFCANASDRSKKTQQQCNLAKTLKKISRKKKK